MAGSKNSPISMRPKQCTIPEKPNMTAPVPGGIQFAEGQQVRQPQTPAAQNSALNRHPNLQGYK